MTIADKWILTRLHDTVDAVSSALDGYDFGSAAGTLYHFIWFEFCDWYLEATKDEYSHATRAAVLSFVLNNTMRLLHPIEPFITEEVWLTLPHDGQTIVTASWPDRAEIPVHRDAVADFEALQRAVERLRNLRVDMGLQNRDVLTLEVPAGVPEAVASLIATLTMGKVQQAQAPGGETLVERLGMVAGRAPKGVLIERYKKEAMRLRSEVERCERKLADERFVSNAKPEVVAKEREKLEGYRAELARVEAALKEMGARE
jgi:valyl-tRNA synthetase